MTTKPVNEEQMVHLVRNALLVAGQEMGNGDQWPVVKDTIYKIMNDWEELKTERNVDEELKTQIYEQLVLMEKGFDECTDEVKAQLRPKINELREVCDAYFSDLDRKAIIYNDGEDPEHIKRMKVILNTMEDDNG